ncbi:hypothetical protein [Paenibacillus agilis]|uniref:hypothetical protein n=1 Tax=Paenibacillus agilis TaxID=3020863 RepID=UPI00164A086D|nr:hypothetical protein [Paenibacillus agilis]
MSLQEKFERLYEQEQRKNARKPQKQINIHSSVMMTQKEILIMNRTKNAVIA